jgi:hypothetical protein
MPINIVRNDRGMIATASTPSGAATGTAFAPNVPDGPFSKAMASLAVAIDAFASVNNSNEGRFQIAAMIEHNLAAVVNVLRGPWIGLQAVGVNEAQSVAAARVRALSVDPTTLTNRDRRDRVLKLWDGTDIAGKARIGASTDIEGLSALIGSGALAEVSDENIRTAIENRYMALRHIQVSGIQSGFALAPNLADPIRTGPDQAAAVAAADQVVEDMKARVDALDSVRTALTSTVAVAAICSDLSVEAAFTLLSTGKLAA